MRAYPLGCGGQARVQKWLTAARILYGGSVNPSNVADFMAQSDIDGALVGGASLQADAFLAITQAIADSSE